MLGDGKRRCIYSNLKRSTPDGTDKASIEVPVTLRSGDRIVSFPAQLDTGATFCVFERGYAETLGLSLESGAPLRFTTATGSFQCARSYGDT
jgi:hypothetical protein